MPGAFAPADSTALSTAKAQPPTCRPSRWGRWLLGTLALLLLLAAAASQLLDPWLRRTLEKQVATQTRRQYRLQEGELHTNLFQRAVRLRRVRLRPAAQVTDTLPRLRLDVERLHVTGVGLWALMRKGVVPIDSVVLDSARIDLPALPRKATRNAGRPLHQQLPLGLEGIALVMSKAAHVVVIRDQNPRKRGELVTGAMTSTREPRFSMFTLWRQGMVSGLFHSVGMPQKLSEAKDEAPLPT